ncbi:MAG: ice-binding family protein, partial [Aequorivita sp.]|nr:ice-binding family protein [Aequorivita sp.]
MKNFTQNSKTTLIRWRYSLGMILMVVLMIPAIAVSQSPAPVNLGTAGNYVVLAKSGISTTGTTSIVGDIGVSPIDHTAITGFGLILDSSGQFSTSSLVEGRIYAADYAPPTPTILTTAVSNMEAAYTDAAGRPADYTELYAGDLTGQTLTSGVYKWGTDVLISAGGVTISGSPTDVWIFQIAGNLTVANTAIVSLSGGAEASNIFWQVAGETTLGTTSDFSGIILCQTLIALQTGAAFDGRALSQTAVTLDGNNIVVGNPPVIACPMDIVANNDPGVCTANVTFANAIAIDEEDGVLTTTQTMGPASGSDFPVGDTIIEFSATDSDGNTVTCQFTITVIDNEAPVAVCQDLTLDLDPVTGTVNITAADVDNGSTDNCGIASMTLDISSFDCSMTGANTVTMTVTDNSGNSTTC